jgi:hypothetical protein
VVVAGMATRTASSAASRIAGFTTPNQLPSATATRVMSAISLPTRRSGTMGVCTKVALPDAVGLPGWSASMRKGTVRGRRSHWKPLLRTFIRMRVLAPGSTPAAGGSKSASTRPEGSMRCRRQLANVLPRFSSIIS